MLAIKDEKVIQDLKVQDALRKIGEAKYGLHCLLIYPNLSTFREFYFYYIQKRVYEKSEIVLFNPFYETVRYVKQNLGMSPIDTNELYSREDASLIIRDSLNQYHGKDEPISEYTKKLIKKAIESGKKGVSILSDMGTYFFKLQVKELMDYEISLPLAFDMPLKGICVYHQLDFGNKLTENQRLKLIDLHGMAIRLNSFC